MAVGPRRGRLLAAVAAAALVGLAAGVATGKPPPPKAEWPPGAVHISTVSNGCGPGAPGTSPSWTGQDSQTYTRADGQTVVVSFRDACDLHDAAYSGALVWDRISDRFIDFSDPRWTKAAINEKFKQDLQRLCFKQISQQPIWQNVTLDCLTTDDIASGTWGALTYLRIVTSIVSKSPRERINIAGRWRYPNPGFPPCDVGVDEWTITHIGRKVTARWEHGTAGAKGRFFGTFVTGDSAGDDRVEGKYKILDGGRVVAEGTMTFAVRSDRKFDFKGPVGSGTMVLVERETQGTATKCKAKPKAKPTPSPAAGSFRLIASLTEVKNPNAPELTVNAAAGTAVWDHTGQYGGAGKGGEWKVAFRFVVPQTLTPGKSSSLTLGLQVSNVQPQQPILFQIGARAPDFKQILNVHYPNPAGASKTFAIPISAGYKDFKELLVIADVVSAEVIYHYRRSR